ncbi:MAG: hypothetical protein LBP56_06655 [Odoribacteraceae bacterium]|jgi:hypothetical protein|nr:hypothetical protein [Odoribacteraceae bacterium]
MKHLIVILLSIALVACHAKKARETVSPVAGDDAYAYFLIDSILQYGLDHEALYTLVGNVKPMSSLVDFSFPVANTDSALSTSGEILTREQHGAYIDRIRVVQEAIGRIRLPDLKFVMIPYKAPFGTTRRGMQISVIRVSALDSLLKARESFFGQFGLVPGSDPAVVATVIEFADRYERFRGYGYLFGYPGYAVDFFVKAFRESDSTGKHVTRNFFQIPVYARNGGYFVYAYPKAAVPTAAVDSALYYRASGVLEHYKRVRSRYLNADSTLQAYQLLKDLAHDTGRQGETPEQ